MQSDLVNHANNTTANTRCSVFSYEAEMVVVVVMAMVRSLASVDIVGRTGGVVDESSCTTAPLREVLGALGATVDSSATLHGDCMVGNEGGTS